MKLAPEETHYEFSVDWKAMAAFHWRRSFADEISPKMRAFHRRAAKQISAKLKKNHEPHSTGRICVRLTRKNEAMKKNDTHCGVCRKPCQAPKGNWNAQAFVLCGKKKCRLQRRCELQRARRAQIVMDFAKRKSKHDSHAKGSKANRAARQSWKSGLSHVPA
jgi:hypothetical protein